MKSSQNGYFNRFSIENKWKEIRIHIWVWGVFIIYETIVIGILFNLFGNPLTYFLHYLVIIPLFYLHGEIAMPWAFKSKSQALWKLPLIVAVQIVVYVLAHYVVDLFLIAIKIVSVKGDYQLNSTFILRNLYRGFFFMGFSTGYYFLKTYIKEKKRTAELEKEQLNAIIQQKSTEQELFRAQNAFLKAQINPHFLFNTLNFIYNKVSVSSPEAAEAVLSLSDMMSYAITSDDRGGMIKLEDEMEQTMNLISLFKLRKAKPIYLKTEFAENTKQLRFIPLVLLTVAENMFKHGQLQDPNHEATLKVYIENEILYFESYNYSRPQKNMRSSTGLENIRKRLNYAYGEEVSFEYSTGSDECFKLKLGVPLERLAEHSR